MSGSIFIEKVSKANKESFNLKEYQASFSY